MLPSLVLYPYTYGGYTGQTISSTVAVVALSSLVASVPQLLIDSVTVNLIHAKSGLHV